MIYLLFWISSFVVYLYSPAEYDYAFCLTLTILYVVMSFFFLRKSFQINSYFNFHLFFLISFFVTNYVYPTFIYQIDPYYFSIFTYSFDHNLISRGTALAQLGISSYMLGSVILMNNRILPDKSKDMRTYNVSTASIQITKFLFFSFTAFFLIYVFLIAPKFKDQVELNSQIVNIEVVLFTIVLTFIILSNVDLYRNNLKLFLRQNIYLVISVVLIILSALWYGDRGIAIQIFFISTYIIYNFIKKIKFTHLLVLIIIGFITLTFISYTRGTEHNLQESALSDAMKEGMDSFSSFESNWEFGMDLIINARNLYVGIEYAENEEFLYGKSYFPYLFILIPGLPTYMTKATFNIEPEHIATSGIITDYSNAGWGIGTNAIADVYMNFGLPGVVFLFFIFGMLIVWLEKQNGVYSLIAYLLIFALAIYYPRASIFEQSALVIRALLIAFILLNLARNKRFVLK